MQIQRVNRTDAEKVFINVNARSGATITTGMGVRFLGGIGAEAVSTDGVQVIPAETNDVMCQFGGIAAEDIANAGYGRSQVWGYVNSIMLSTETDKTIGITALAQTFLQVSTVKPGSFTSAQTAQDLSTFLYKYVQIWSTVNISGGVPYGVGFVRAL